MIRIQKMADEAARGTFIQGEGEGDADADEQITLGTSLENDYRSSERVVRALVDIAEDETEGGDPEHLTLSFSRLEKEAQVKLTRAKRVTAGWRYLMFFVVYSATIILQKNASRSVLTVDALRSLMLGGSFPDRSTSGVPWKDKDGPNPRESGCYTDSCSTPTFEHKSFLQIETVQDVWDWLEHFLIPTYYVDSWENGRPMAPDERNTYLMRSRPIGPLRLIQNRALPGSVTMGQLSKDCIAHAQPPMSKFAPVCYDELSFCQDAVCVRGHTQKTPFGVFTNFTKYRYSVTETGVAGLHPTVSGYQTIFPAEDKKEALGLVRELKQDRWIEQSTQWMSVFFTVLNADENLFVDLQLTISIHTTGLLVPSLHTSATPTERYNLARFPHLARTALEGLVLLLFLLQIIRNVNSVRHRRAEVLQLHSLHLVSEREGFVLGCTRSCLENPHALILDL